MAGYGDAATIRAMLGPGEASDGFQAELDARIDAMQQTVSALVEDRTGRTWSDDPVTPATRTIYPAPGYSRVLVLPVPAVTITGITTSQLDAGGVLSGGYALTTDYWSVAARDRDGHITAIRTGGYWTDYAAVTITGTWAADAGSVPVDIQWAVNYITAERIKQEQASPAGFVGPDGTVTPVRDPWADPQVKKILGRHTLITRGLVV